MSKVLVYQYFLSINDTGTVRELNLRAQESFDVS